VSIPGDTLYRTTGVPWTGGALASVRTGLVFSNLDRPILPTRGTTAGVAVETASPLLGSTLTLERLDAFASTNQPIGPLVLHVGGSFHSVLAPGQLVPMTERLYLDGSSDIRGYAPGSLLAYGGAYEALGRASIEVPILKSVGLSIEGFGDVGELWNEYREGVFGASFGFGVIWRSPLGPLRFDWAFPLVGKPQFVFGAGVFL
jgi:outer membrane protein assembly factor BamA